MSDIERQINYQIQTLREGKSQLFELISLCRQTEQYGLGILLGECFMNFIWSEDNFHIALDELGICYHYSKQYENSWMIYERLIQHGFIQPERMKQLVHNATYNLTHILDNLPPFEGTIIANSCRMVTFTITTCKRLDLFIRTMNSFLNCCLDHHLIYKWVCIDDNSSEEDRAIMKEKFPFFEFIWKNEDDKGHAKSMNMLLKAIDTPYVFHMEDDWEFYLHRPYIENCIDGLKMGYAQCLVNPNYAEIPDDNIIGGEYKLSRNGTVIIEHVHEPDSVQFTRRFGLGSNCAYWPHYSLRPGMTQVRVLREIGDYAVGVEHFEMEYAYRYVSAGHKTSFLYPSGCKHIGRLTSEMNSDVPNAYTLNDEIQFSNSERIRRPTTSTSSDYHCVIINLDRRSDRLHAVTPIMKQLHGIRFPAIDGKNVTMSRQLEQIFNPNDYNFRRGIIGCALSHIQLWIEYIDYITDKALIVLEDDIQLSDRFSDVVASILPRDDWDIVMIGYHQRGNGVDTMTRVENAITAYDISLGGTHGYMITQTGAKKMLNYIQLFGMTNAIDTMIQNAADCLRLWYAENVVNAECIDHNSNVDSDIQRDYTSLRRELSVRILDEIRGLHELEIPVRLCKDNTCSTISTRGKDVAIICENGQCDSLDGYWEDSIDEACLRLPKMYHHKYTSNYRLLRDGMYFLNRPSSVFV